MNVQTFLYNENFYKKLALTIAIIRLTPSHLTPKDYTIYLQNNLRKTKINETIQYEQTLLDVHFLRKSLSIIIPTKSFDLLEHHGKFLQHILTISTEFNFDIQTIIIESIDHIFQLIKENFRQIKQEKYEALFKQLITIILNFHIIPNIQQHSIEHIRNFINLILMYIQDTTITTNAQILIEQIGCHPSYFLLVFERILIELFANVDKINSNSTYSLILINILQKLVTLNDNTTLEQILNNESVRQQFHALLYTCLSKNNIDISLIVCLWNIYGRII
ncbi:unnamed protein product [Adineta steineri]|uniref:Uncharacterized protein n=1 Tax=Adineta steineri TaxID=433720 RepID=A0A819H5S8_9BILA|nr:unnamed protein product [Adineta steineri]CAF3892225.1 unnamed protein product [Adineta steineri]